MNLAAARARLLPLIDQRGADECWPCKLALLNTGYGQVRFEGKKWSAHRLVYIAFVGPIPKGHDVDHRCHNEDASCPGGVTCPHRACLNPRHLQTSTRGDNVRSGRNAQRRKTHCPKGHEYTEENTYVGSEGWRQCRACHRDQERLRKQASVC